MSQISKANNISVTHKNERMSNPVLLLLHHFLTNTPKLTEAFYYVT